MPDIVSWGMFLLGITLMIVILLRRWFRYYYHRQPSRQQAIVKTKRQSSTAGRSLSNAPDDVLLWQVEMHETARELKGELDSKMCALQVLIRQSREEAARLERLLSACREITDTKTRGCAQQVDEATVEHEPQHILPWRSGQNAADKSARGQSADAAAAQASLLVRQAEMLKLAEQGLTSAVIAQKVELPIGDVELFLSLHPSHRPDGMT